TSPPAAPRQPAAHFQPAAKAANWSGATVDALDGLFRDEQAERQRRLDEAERRLAAIARQLGPWPPELLLLVDALPRDDRDTVALADAAALLRRTRLDDARLADILRTCNPADRDRLPRHSVAVALALAGCAQRGLLA